MKKQTVLDWFNTHPSINFSEFARECGWKTSFYLYEQLGERGPDTLRKNFVAKILPVLKSYGFNEQEAEK